MAPSRVSYVCATCAKSLLPSTRSSGSRAFTTSISNHQTETSSAGSDPDQIPRWKQTPPGMKMPVRLRPQPRQSAIWKVNEWPEPLDKMYDRFIGKAGGGIRGRDCLPEEIKWQAVTHKSFDQGRRPFNDRLAFLGKRIVDLQTSLALLNAPSPHLPPSKQGFDHPSLEGVENVTLFAKSSVLEPTRLAQLASSYGVDRVMRWKPRKSGNLASSGVSTVLAHTVYSIVGALALQRGGEVATRMVRERVLQPLGLR